MTEIRTIAESFEVDDDTFRIQSNGDALYRYEWLTGPNPGYGFSIWDDSAIVSADRHRDAIVDFLSRLDPDVRATA